MVLPDLMSCIILTSVPTCFLIGKFTYDSYLWLKNRCFEIKIEPIEIEGIDNI